MPGDPEGTSPEGGAVAPAPPHSSASTPGNQDVERQLAENISSTATPAGSSQGSNSAQTLK